MEPSDLPGLVTMHWALAFAGVFHSLFESWMLSFSGPLLVTFLVVLVVCLQMDFQERLMEDRLIETGQRRSIGRMNRRAL